MSAATYYKMGMNKGFLIVSFKNGQEIIIIIKPNKAFHLSGAFTFNKETKRVIVQTMTKPFGFEPTELTYEEVENYDEEEEQLYKALQEDANLS